jgi:hypothetical protein
MGVLCDYFVAADDMTAIAALDLLGPDHSPASSRGAATGFEAIDLKGIEPTVILGKLIALVRGIEWQAGLADGSLLWTPDEDYGPWVVPVPDAARDTLADIGPQDLPQLAERWSTIEEFWGHGNAGACGAVIEQLSSLARRARNADHRVYSWSAL